MTYQPKVIRCRLHTGGKTIQKIRERYAGQGMTYRDFESIQRANEEFDGLVVLLSLWDYDNHEAYHLHNWNPEDDERMMMAIYHSEQVHPFPRYKNALEQFKADWAAGTYDPGATLCFQPEDVEEIEVLCEEIVPEPQTATPPPRTPKKNRYGLFDGHFLLFTHSGFLTFCAALFGYRYFGGFRGSKAVLAATEEACRVAVRVMREYLEKKGGEPV